MKKEDFTKQIMPCIVYLANQIQIQGDKLDDKLTLKQYILLLTIEHLPKGEASYNNIACKMGCSKQNVKQIVTALEKKNHIQIQRVKNDKRAVNIIILPDSKKIIQDYYYKNIFILNNVFKEFSVKETEELYRLLKKLIKTNNITWEGYEKNIWSTVK